MAAWLRQPVVFESNHDFDCEGFEPDQCQYYKERWHNWYVADWTFALPTVAFFMSTIGVFVVGYFLTKVFALSHKSQPSVWRRVIAMARYLSYRGFHIRRLRWNSPPFGVLMLGAIGTVYFFCMDLIPSLYYWPGSDMVWGASPPLGTRSGWLALACMPFIFATATKSNWITVFTGVSHEKLQVFHRWIAYAFMVLALMHTFPFIIWHIRNGDMVYEFTVDSLVEYWTGIVALVFQAWLTFASWGPFRNLGYEFFKASHFLSVIGFMVIFFWHCGGTLTSWHYFVATAAIYVPCLTYPWLRTFFEYGTNQKAQIFAEDNGFTRITIPANFKWHPGQHCFLRFRKVGVHALSSHPFTICSLPTTSSSKPSELVFYIRPQGGFTARLHNYAMTHPGAKIPVFVDGPYGGIDNQKFFSSDRLVVVAGGSGAGWVLPFVEQFLRYHSPKNFTKPMVEGIQAPEQTSHVSAHHRRTHGPQSLRVILSTRDQATGIWFKTTLINMLSDYKSPETLFDVNIEVHSTGEAGPIPRSSSKPPSDLERSGSSSAGEEEIIEKPAGGRTKVDTTNESDGEVRSRPDLPSIIHQEAAAASEMEQAVGVFVCGPITMQNDARNAVAKENLKILKNPRSGGVYLHLEHFSWA